MYSQNAFGGGGGGYNPSFGGGFGGSAFGGGYGGGYGGSPNRGRGRRDDRGRGRGRGGFSHGNGHGGDGRAPPPESSNARMRKMIVKFADEEDFHPTEDPPRLAKVLRRQWREGSHGVMDGFRIGVTQEPHKHAHYVTLLLALSYRSADIKNEPEAESSAGTKRKAEGSDEPDCGREVLEDMSRAFRGWVEGREWLNMRLGLQFFSLLPAAGLVSPFSMIGLYKSLLSVLSEVGGGGDRAERVVRAVGEGLMRSAKALHSHSPEDVDGLIDSIETSISGRRTGKTLRNPFSPILPEGEEAETQNDSLDNLLLALQALRADSYDPPACLPSYHSGLLQPENTGTPEPYDLSAASMPPELYDVDEDRWQVGEGQVGNIKLFGDDIIAPPSTADGWTMRSLVLDLVHIFEVNRKETARILLTLPRYFTSGTFKSSSSTGTETTSASTLSLESLLITTLLNAMTLLPTSPCKEVYYTSVIAELCKLSPNTVAPPVGRSVRKLYTMLGSDGLDNEVVRRITEWFAVHLSNFGFQWMWKEWVPDLELPSSHPKKAFMRRIVELEIRLAYHDRIMDSLPETMAAEASGVLSAAPDPVWQYESADHPLHSEAADFLKILRQRTSASDVQAHLVTLRNATSGPGEALSREVRLMVAETLLQLGSRSFSHFLNATERYSDLLRFLTPDPASRQDLLSAIGSFWRHSSQMRLIVIDKYIQYGVLESLDVIDWTFAPEEGLGGMDRADGWTDAWKWEVLRMTLDKQVGRVLAVRRKVRQVEREDEAARARRAAERLESGEGVGEGESMEAEGEDARLDRSKAGREAQVSLDIHTTQLEKILLATTKHFITSLLPWTSAGGGTGATADDGLKAVLELADSGEDGWWPIRARLGWYREYVRLHAQHLASLGDVLQRDVFAEWKGEGVEGRAEEMVKGLWAASMGAEE